MLAVITLVVAGAWGAGAAAGHDDPCHQDGSCPSDDHSYTWSGMSCTSKESERLPEDQIPVHYDGVDYWCHVVTDQGMTPPAKPVPPPAGGGVGTPARCAATRATVRNLTDADTGSVGASATATTIARLARMRAPRALGARRTTGAERRRYRAQARLVAARRSHNGEWVLTVADPQSGARLAVAFPAPSCVSGAASALRSQMTAARRGLVDGCDLPDRTGERVRVTGTAELTGVGFFAAARGRLSLRPVLRLAHATCRRR